MKNTRCILLIAAFLLACSPVFGQAVSVGNFEGTVTD